MREISAVPVHVIFGQYLLLFLVDGGFVVTLFYSLLRFMYMSHTHTLYILIHLSTNTQYPEESLLRTKFLPLLQKHIENMTPAKVVPEKEREIVCCI